MCLLFIAVINTICVLLSNILTTLLYNGAVTDKWNRSHMYTKMQFADQSAILQAAKDLKSDEVLDTTGSRPGSEEDFFKVQSEIKDVQAAVSGRVDILDRKIADVHEVMTRNMDTLRRQVLSVPRGSILIAGGDISYNTLKSQIEEKTQALSKLNTEKERESANIELEKLYVMFEATPEYKMEESAITEEKRRIYKDSDIKALEDMRAKYSEQSVAQNESARFRLKALPAIALLLLSPADIVKKPANEWKYITTSGLTVDEMKAIRANLPQFGRHQLRQLVWVQSLEDRIDAVLAGVEKVHPLPSGSQARLSAQLRTSSQRPSSESPRGTPHSVELLAEVKRKDVKLKKVSFPE